LDSEMRSRGFGVNTIDKAKATLKADRKVYYQKGATGEWWICWGAPLGSQGGQDENGSWPF
jgi:hypothetical protein